MKESSFVARHRQTWERYEEVLDAAESKHVPIPVHEFPALYRSVCRHLSIARHRGYGPEVTGRLNPLVERGHERLYGTRVGNFERVVDYVAGGFARDVRRDWKYLLLALVIFFGAGAAVFAWLTAEPEWAYHVLGPRNAANMEMMYADPMVGRESDSDVVMFGFYIRNNVGIALRTFAAGIFFGFGSLFILGFNALFLGAAAAHVTNAGLGPNFWPFVVGHGAFELTAIALAGQTGFRLGLAAVWPGRKTRRRALSDAGRECAGIVLGFAAMLVIAAFIEAFWSSSAATPSVKYAVGAMLWSVVILYFAMAGRE